MRHLSKRHNFHRRPGPRVALIRGLVYSLVEHGRIKTTVARAKEIRRHVEKAITVSKRGGLNVRRILLARYPNDNVINILTTDLNKRFAKRPGGYTRIVKIGARPGDQADMAFLEFVDYVPKAATDETTVKAADPKAEERSRANAKTAEKLRKRVRKKAAESRREARWGR
jgi:large subunit ribosomal protein L17